MDARPGNALRAAFPLGLLLWLPTVAPAADSAEVLPLQVRDGRSVCVVATPRADDKYFLVVGSLTSGTTPHRVTVRARPTTEPVHLTPDSTTEVAWGEQIKQRGERLTKARLQPPPAEYAATEPPASRTFFIFTGDQDFHDPAAYATVKGRLRGTGDHCSVYVDLDQPDPDRLQPTVDDIVRTFDREVWPTARKHFGTACDVDRDGRFTILLTGLLDRLQNGRTSLGGFVRGSDFYRDLRAPFGNRCDMMFLNTDLTPGPHLHNLLAHEFTHAVVFSEHVFGDYLPEAGRQDEESWLNEGLAHLAEDLHGYGWSNLDFRVSAFLSSPGQYPLVVADYYRAGLWRTPGIRGASYLFLRWCTDTAGPDLAAKLTRTNLTGIANLETACEKSFADLFRRWSLALLLSGTGMEPPATSPLRRIDPRAKLGDRLLCGPRFGELLLHGGERELEIQSTTASYLLLHSPRAARCRVEVCGPDDAGLQVTLVKLPPETGRLSLRCEADGDGVRLVARAFDTGLSLTGAGWELLSPAGPRDRAVSAQPRDWFARTDLARGQETVSRPLDVDRASPVVFKVSAVDARGRAVSAWATWPTTTPR